MRVFSSIFKRPMTVALIRHAYINTIDFNTLSIKDKKEIATSMGHTIETQDSYRLLFDDKKAECDCVCTAKDKAGNKEEKEEDKKNKEDKENKEAKEEKAEK